MAKIIIFQLANKKIESFSKLVTSLSENKAFITNIIPTHTSKPKPEEVAKLVEIQGYYTKINDVIHVKNE